SFENNARGLERPVFNRHQAGASLGGPIVQDKAFFFGSFESVLVRSTGASKTFHVPTPQLLSIVAPATRAVFQRFPAPTDFLPGDVLTRTIQPYQGGASVTI